MTDRLVSLRLLNVTRDEEDGCEWAKSYTPCVGGEPVKPWHKALEIQPNHDVAQVIYLSEPLMTDPAMQSQLLRAMEEGYGSLPAAAGYYDLPELTRFIREGAQSGLWGDEITPNMMAPGCFWLCDGAG